MTTDDKPLMDARSESRTNMFVMATIYAGSGSAPVKIRNLSSKGALIEGGLIPPLATKVSLRRGNLSIAGEILWRSDGRAGLKFDSLISVAHWLPGGESLLQQERVDAIFQGIKNSTDVPATMAEAQSGAVTAFEMIKLKEMIESLSEDLADDMDVISRHGSKLQSLDLAAQMLGKLAAGLG